MSSRSSRPPASAPAATTGSGPRSSAAGRPVASLAPIAFTQGVKHGNLEAVAETPIEEDASAEFGERKPAKPDDDTVFYVRQLEVPLQELLSTPAAAAADGVTPSGPLAPVQLKSADRLLVRNVFREIEHKEASLATHKMCSVALELLLRLAAPQQLAAFLRGLQPYASFTAGNRFGSHVMETLLSQAYRYLAGELPLVREKGSGGGDSESDDDDEDDGSDSDAARSKAQWRTAAGARAALVQVLLQWAQLVRERVAGLLFDPAGGHVVRSLACVLAGQDPRAHSHSHSNAAAAGGAGGRPHGGAGGGAAREGGPTAGAGGFSSAGGGAGGASAGGGMTYPTPAALRTSTRRVYGAVGSANAALLQTALLNFMHSVAEADFAAAAAAAAADAAAEGGASSSSSAAAAAPAPAGKAGKAAVLVPGAVVPLAGGNGHGVVTLPELRPLDAHGNARVVSAAPLKALFSAIAAVAAAAAASPSGAEAGEAKEKSEKKEKKDKKEKEGKSKSSSSASASPSDEALAAAAAALAADAAFGPGRVAPLHAPHLEVATDSNLVAMACDTAASPALQGLIKAAAAALPAGGLQYLARRVAGMPLALDAASAAAVATASSSGAAAASSTTGLMLTAAQVSGAADVAATLGVSLSAPAPASAAAAGGAGKGGGKDKAGSKRDKAAAAGASTDAALAAAAEAEALLDGTSAAGTASASAEGKPEGKAKSPLATMALTLESVVTHPTGARAIEALLAYADAPLHGALHAAFFKRHAPDCLADAAANFALQRLLVSCHSAAQAEAVLRDVLRASHEGAGGDVAAVETAPAAAADASEEEEADAAAKPSSSSASAAAVPLASAYDLTALFANKREGVVLHIVAAAAGAAAVGALPPTGVAVTAAAAAAAGGGSAPGSASAHSLAPLVPIFTGQPAPLSAPLQALVIRSLLATAALGSGAAPSFAAAAASVAAGGTGATVSGGPAGKAAAGHAARWLLDLHGFRSTGKPLTDPTAAAAGSSSAGLTLPHVQLSPAGSRVVAAALRMRPESAKPLLTSLLALTGIELACLASDAFASRHIIEPLVASREDGLKWAQRELQASLKGFWPRVAASRFGCWVVTKTVTEGAADTARRRANIADELSAAEAALAGTPAGRTVVKVLRLQHYRQNADSWHAVWARAGARAAILGDILGDAAGAGPSSFAAAGGAGAAGKGKGKAAASAAEDDAAAAAEPAPITGSKRSRRDAEAADAEEPSSKSKGGAGSSVVAALSALPAAAPSKPSSAAADSSDSRAKADGKEPKEKKEKKEKKQKKDVADEDAEAKPVKVKRAKASAADEDADEAGAAAKPSSSAAAAPKPKAKAAAAMDSDSDDGGAGAGGLTMFASRKAATSASAKSAAASSAEGKLQPFLALLGAGAPSSKSKGKK